jgi:CARDB protein
MPTLRLARRRAAIAALATSSVWSACSDQSPTQVAAPPSPTQSQFEPAHFRREDVRAALSVLERHRATLMRTPGVVGTAIGASRDGKLVVRVLLETKSVAGIPATIDGLPVAAEVTGLLMARSDPTLRLRPAPLGYSVGHPSITAGSIGARVVDPSGNVYVLSNNHVLAASNAASIGDPELQPGAFDGGTFPADQIATLFAFHPIDFSSSGTNSIDAAIALSDANSLGNATPLDDGYGAPSGTIFGDANGDGVFDDVTALLNLPVQKFGRTTKLTHGTITGINASVSICYEVTFIFCTKSATFVNQLIIEPGGFSGGGDSGSLIVTDNDARNPVALLFAGSSTQTIGNRIDLVLNEFGVKVDGGNSPPPPPLTDVAVTGIAAPTSVTVGTSANVTVTVRNAGNQPVASGIDVTLNDVTDGVTLGTQTIPGLAAGASTTLTFAWSTTSSSLGTHTLTATQAFVDDNAANDQRSTTSSVVAVSTGMHVGDLDGSASRNQTTWTARVQVYVHDANHALLNGATVVGRWSVTGLNSDTCTTGELGSVGTCIFLFPSLSRSITSVRFTVTSVTRSGSTYQPSQNHDVDGSSNGTTVTVVRP